MTFAIDLTDEKLDFARKIGAVATVNAANTPNVVKAVKEITNGGAHMSIDALGHPTTSYNSISNLRRRGRHVQVGLMLGDYGGANVVAVYGAYAFNEHLAAELALGHILGNFSDGQYATIGVTHVPVPEWRIQPFLSIGTGVIRVRPEGTLVGTEERTDQVAYAGVGVRAHMARRFIVRGEIKEYVVFTDRDENEEDVEWKIGFAFFF
jgi:hypothetical protein